MLTAVEIWGVIRFKYPLTWAQLFLVYMVCNHTWIWQGFVGRTVGDICLRLESVEPTFIISYEAFRILITHHYPNLKALYSHKEMVHYLEGLSWSLAWPKIYINLISRAMTWSWLMVMWTRERSSWQRTRWQINVVPDVRPSLSQPYCSCGSTVQHTLFKECQRKRKKVCLKTDVVAQCEKPPAV